MASASFLERSRSRTGDRVFIAALVLSAMLHAGTLFVIHRWGECFCSFGKVVCPKMGLDCHPRLNLQLLEEEKPPPPPPPKSKPKPKPKPAVIVEQPKPDKPPAAPKAGKVVLPDEAFDQQPAMEAEIKLDRPTLDEDVVVKESEVEATVIATGEIFGRAHELTPGEPGQFGLGGTGTAIGLGPFGTEDEGGGTGPVESSAPVAPKPPAKPTGPSRPPRVLNWTDPPYPTQARQQGIEGVVLLKLTVDAAGKPRNVTIARSSGHSGLDDAAVNHVKKARFSPALKDGEPVGMTISFRVKFRLVNT